MYALIHKIADNLYGGQVRVIAVSKSKDKLMAMLPHEVEAWKRKGSRNAKEFPELFNYNLFRFILPHGYEPLDYWAEGAFDKTRFEVVKVPEI